MGMTTQAWGGAGAGAGRGLGGGGVGTLDGVWGSSIFFFTATKKISLFQKYPSHLHYLHGQRNPGSESSASAGGPSNRDGTFAVKKIKGGGK